MSAYEIAGFLYIMAISVSMISFAMILVFVKKGMAALSKNIALVLSMAFLVMLISLLYFSVDYYSVITARTGAGGVIRVLDAWVTVSIQYLWFFFVRSLFFRTEWKRFWQTVKIIYFVVLAVNLLVYGFFMNEGYYVEDSGMQIAGIFLEVAEGVVSIAVNLFLLSRVFFGNGTQEQDNKLKGCYAAGSLLILVATCQGVFSGYGFISGKIVLQHYNDAAFPLNSLTWLLFAVVLLFYLVNCCMGHKRVGADAGQLSPKNSAEALHEVIAAFADAYDLSERESSVAELLYKGHTYQQISDELYISINTTKHHVTSLYKKLSVSTKMELINLFRDKQNS